MNSFTHYLDQWIGRLHHLRRNYNQTVPLNEQIRHTKEKIFFEVVRRCIERMNRKVPRELCFQFRTNRGDLSRKIDISESAVYRGLKVLEKAGFIQIFSKGRELGFDIFVNPQIFFDFKQEHPFYLHWNEVDKSVENYLTDEPMIQVSFGFNLILFKNLACFMSERPHKNISSKLVNNESEKWISSSKQKYTTHSKQKKGIHTIKKEAQKASFSDKAQDNRREWVGWYKHYLLESGKIKNKENHVGKFAKLCFANSRETQDDEKEGSGLYQNTLQPDFEKQSIHKLLNPAQASILDCAERVWKVAQQYLYPHFTKESAFYEYQIINQIIDVIELEYLPLMQIKTLREYYKEFCQRIVLVACYLDKHAGDKYVPSPVDYFNPRNSRGFVGTRKWLLNKLDRKEQNKKAYQKKRLLQKAEKAFLDAKLEGVEATAFQIYRYFERQVNSFQDTTVQNSYAKLAQRFCVDRT